MKINTFLYKNKKMVKKHLNINARYVKNMHRLEFKEENFQVIVTFNDNEIEYIRDNQEYIFTIKCSSKKSQSFIELEDKKFEIRVIKCIYKYNTTKLYLSYILESDLDNENEIIIEILN